jgi:hypothetical protein
MLGGIFLYIIVCVLCKIFPYEEEYKSHRRRVREDEEAFFFTDASDFHF